MSEIEVEGKTVEEAIQEGLGKLGCSQDKVEIKILNEGTSGLFGLMGNKPSRVRLITKERVIDYILAQNSIRDILSNMLRLMNLNYKDINTAMLTGRLMVNIKSDDSRLIIGKNGQTLDALEHILNLMLNKNENTRTKVTLDTEGYRQQQEGRLQNIALKVAAQVKRTGKIHRFDPMSSRERRLIHISLKSDQDIETISEGEGIYRKVVVKPANHQ